MSTDSTHTDAAPRTGIIEGLGTLLMLGIAGLVVLSGLILIAVSIFNTGSIDLGGHS